MNVCLHVVSAPLSCSSHGSEKRVLGLRNWSYSRLLAALWGLGIEPGSSTGAASTSNR